MFPVLGVSPRHENSGASSRAPRRPSLLSPYPFPLTLPPSPSPFFPSPAPPAPRPSGGPGMMGGAEDREHQRGDHGAVKQQGHRCREPLNFTEFERLTFPIRARPKTSQDNPSSPPFHSTSTSRPHAGPGRQQRFRRGTAHLHHDTSPNRISTGPDMCQGRRYSSRRRVPS